MIFLLLLVICKMMMVSSNIFETYPAVLSKALRRMIF